MPNVETIYKESIMLLPISDQIRLAEIIMEQATRHEPSANGRRSALELLESGSDEKLFSDASEIDQYLKAERESWDN